MCACVGVHVVNQSYVVYLSTHRCGACAACNNIMDCRLCRFCKDLPKYGGPGRARQKCIARQCLRLSKILYTEEALRTGNLVVQEEMAEEFISAGLAVPKMGDPQLFFKVEEESDVMLSTEEDKGLVKGYIKGRRLRESELGFGNF